MKAELERMRIEFKQKREEDEAHETEIIRLYMLEREEIEKRRIEIDDLLCSLVRSFFSQTVSFCPFKLIGGSI